MAEQPWEVAPDGWTVTRDLQGWRLRIEVILGGLRISASEPGEVSAVWIVACQQNRA